MRRVKKYVDTEAVGLVAVDWHLAVVRPVRVDLLSYCFNESYSILDECKRPV